MANAFSDKQGNLSSRFAPIYILLSDYDYNSEPVQLLFFFFFDLIIQTRWTVPI